MTNEPLRDQTFTKQMFKVDGSFLLPRPLVGLVGFSSYSKKQATSSVNQPKTFSFYLIIIIIVIVLLKHGLKRKPALPI